MARERKADKGDSIRFNKAVGGKTYQAPTWRQREGELIEEAGLYSATCHRKTTTDD